MKLIDHYYEVIPSDSVQTIRDGSDYISIFYFTVYKTISILGIKFSKRLLKNEYPYKMCLEFISLHKNRKVN